MAKEDFLGRGMKFPPQIDESTGRFKTSPGLESVKESVYIILMTMLGERWLHTGFGSNIMDFTFTDVSMTTLNVMKTDITDAILRNEPRISGVEVEMDDDENEDEEGKLIIKIDYWVTGSHQRDSMVFPFYMNADREVNDNE